MLAGGKYPDNTVQRHVKVIAENAEEAKEAAHQVLSVKQFNSVDSSQNCHYEGKQSIREILEDSPITITTSQLRLLAAAINNLGTDSMNNLVLPDQEFLSREE
jgi:hypothetical protein